MVPFPLEIWAPIIQELCGVSEWLALSQTCKVFRTVAQVALYKNIELSLHDAQDCGVTDPLLRSITERPELQSFVHSVGLRDSESFVMQPHVSHPCLNVLPSFSNLQSLFLWDIYIDLNLRSVLSSLPCLIAVQFNYCEIQLTLTQESAQEYFASEVTIFGPKLGNGWAAVIPKEVKTLDIGFVILSPLQLYSELMVHGPYHSLIRLRLTKIPPNLTPFLMTFPQLRHLSLHFDINIDGAPSAVHSLPAEAIPLLETFSGLPEYMEPFIRGRPVHTVVLRMAPDIPLDTLHALNLPSVPVRHLQLFIDGTTLDLLQHLPFTLHHFELEDYDEVLAPTINLTIFSATVKPADVCWISALSRMSDLRFLKISGCPITLLEQEEILDAATEAFVSLQELVFRVPPSDIKRYTLWHLLRPGVWDHQPVWYHD